MRRSWAPPKLDDSVKFIGGCGDVELQEEGATGLGDDDDTTRRQSSAHELSASSLIIPGLYVGSMKDGADALLRGNPLGVHAVVNCAQEDWLHQVRKGRCGDGFAAHTTDLREAFDNLDDAPEGGARCGKVLGMPYMGFSAQDVDLDASPEKTPTAAKSYMVADYFPATMAFLRQRVGSGQKVLIHCLRGENRSAAVCAAFLIREHGMSCDEAINLLREKRGENALSNQSFVDQLRRLSPLPPAKPEPSPPSCKAMEADRVQLPDWPPTPVKPVALPEETIEPPHAVRRSFMCSVL